MYSLYVDDSGNIGGVKRMQPVTITNLDRVLTALVQARQRGELSPDQVVLDVRPHEPGSAHVFTVRDDAGREHVLVELRFDEPLPDNYASEIRRRGYHLELVDGR